MFGRLNAVIDAAMDAGYELGDQHYRNACKLLAGLIAICLAVWAGYLLQGTISGAKTGSNYMFTPLFWQAVFAGAVAVPVAPIAKNLASSLQDAAAAVAASKS